MRVYVIPADDQGCGHHRLIWPAEILRAAGHDIRIIPPSLRQMPMRLSGRTVISADYPKDADVIVLQRVTDGRVASLVPYLRGQGVAVVVDIDDDLAAIHPGNPAFDGLQPGKLRASTEVTAANFPGRRASVAVTLAAYADDGYHNAWRYLGDACRDATLVTVSTPGLLGIYAAHGRGRVIYNHLAAHYYTARHLDSEVVGWPASMGSHPNDPQVTRPAIPRLVRDGVTFRMIGNPAGAGAAFGLEHDPPGTGHIALLDWPRAVAAGLGVGIVPLADSRFNRRKSWLKGAEMAACGVPFAASPRPEYVRLAKLGAGWLAKDGRDWYRKLRRLVADERERAELAESGRAAAAALAWTDHAWRVAEAWADALAIQRGGKVPASG
jgi:hypothetical protein